MSGGSPLVVAAVAWVAPPEVGPGADSPLLLLAALAVESPRARGVLVGAWVAVLCASGDPLAASAGPVPRVCRVGPEAA